MDDTPMLTVDQLTVRYRERATPVLDAVSFDVHPGRITAVVGPNGSGKSTVVRALLGRVPTASGRVLLQKQPIETLAANVRAQRMAVVTQREDNVLPLLVDEFVMLGRYPHRGPFGAPTPADREAVYRAMARTGMEALQARRVDTLSGGEWQRVRLARALAQEAPLLVLDEPTTFLDIAHEMAIFELADTLALEGRGVLLVSHQLNLVARFAAQIVLLRAGRVVAKGSADDVMQGAILEQVYGWPLVVTRDPAVGAPALLPLRGQGRRESPESGRIG